MYLSIERGKLFLHINMRPVRENRVDGSDYSVLERGSSVGGKSGANINYAIKLVFTNCYGVL
jgi:hypothetical protein